MSATALGTERLSILVVEDNPADADLVRELLREAGPVAAGAVAAEVHHVQTLRQALAEAKRGFDVAILDLGLPDASGFEAVVALHAAVPDMPAVVLTSAREPSLGARALVEGAQDFFVKGEVEGEMLLRALRFAVARQHQYAREREHGRTPRAPDRGDRAHEHQRGVHAGGSPLALARVLLVEDNDGDADLVRAALEEANALLQVDHVHRMGEALDRLSRGDVGAVLLDLSLPDSLGVESVEKLRATFPRLPLVVLTGTTQTADDALRAGAQDYLVKGQFDGPALVRALRFSVERQHHLERLLELEAERAARKAAEAGEKRLTVALIEAREAKEREAAARIDAEWRRRELEALFGSMIDPVFVYGPDGRIASLNLAATELLGDVRGLTPADLLDRFQMTDAGGRPLTADRVPSARALAGETVRAERIRVQSSSGERVMLVSSAPLRGDVTRGAVSVYRDVTEHEHAAQSLRRSEMLHRSIARNIPGGAVLVTDGDLRIRVAEGSLLSTLGFVADTMEGSTLGEMLDGATARVLTERFGKALGGESGSYESEHRGRVIWSQHVPLRDDAGRLDGAMALCLDVTDRKAAEIERERLVEKLRRMDERKNEFLAMLSHELRNPLAPIRNAMYILDRVVPDGERARRARSVIARQLDHMTRLVDDLLDVTRVSRGKIRLKRERLELNRVVRDTAEDYRSVFASHGVELETVTAARTLCVNADAIRVAQVIGNLLQNAAKFTPRGGRTTLTLEAAGETSAVIRVRDTGAGIAPDLIPTLFEPFVQAEKTLDRSHGGLGLGLALVKGLAEIHGGTVGANSAGAGHGAEFVITLPLDRADARGAMDMAVPLAHRRSRRILVVDDDADLAETLRAVLEMKAHVVEVAGTGTEALDKARRFRPEVVICDIGLPEMDGFQVARKLRSHPAFQRTPLVALSGYGATEDLERAREAGFDQHVAKPIDPDELERVVNEVADAKAG